MIKFFLGFVAAIALAALAVFCYVRFGFLDPRADIQPGSLEENLAMPALDASIDRRAPAMKNPMQPTEENLLSGMRIYQANCSGCHGDISHPHQGFGDSFYPRAPQFMEDAPDMPENQNFYIIAHGIRLSGMPAWKTTLKESEIWQVTAFLSSLNKLPPRVLDGWKVASTGTGATPSSESGAQPATNH
jgi:mono/diheme cytochrome c family protein